MDFGVHPFCLVKLRRGNVTSTVPESYSYIFRHVVQVLSRIFYTHQDGSRLPSKKCVDGSDNRLGKFLFQIIEATRGGMPARDGNRSPRDDRSWGSRAKDFVICAEAACIDRLPYCNRGAVEVSWLYCCSYRGPIAQRKGMGIVEVVECMSVYRGC